MTACDICIGNSMDHCESCPQGNPCYGCEDYDAGKKTCRSGGGCAGIHGGNKQDV